MSKNFIFNYLFKSTLKDKSMKTGVRGFLLLCILALGQSFSRNIISKTGTISTINNLQYPKSFHSTTRNGAQAIKLRPIKTTTILHAAPSVVTATASSLIGANDMWTLWAVASTAAAVGLKLEKSTAVGKALSGPVCAMLCTAILTNFGVLPAGGSVYLTQLQVFVVKLATPLLLLGADLNKIFRQTGVLLKAFLLGTFGTLVGSTLGFILFGPSMRAIGIDGDAWKIAAALTAKNIGGGLNFMSVCGALQVNPVTIGTGLAVDNLLGLLYFPFISWLGRGHQGDGSAVTDDSTVLGGTILSNSDATSIKVNEKDTTATAADEVNGNEKVEQLTTALSISMILVAISEMISMKFHIPSVPTVTFLTVMLVRKLMYLYIYSKK